MKLHVLSEKGKPMKKILFVNGSYNEIPLIKAAHSLGFYVITSGNDLTGEGHRYANEYIPCDYSDKEAIYEIAKREQVDAICSCGNDFGAISAAYACEKLGLPGHDTYQNARYFHEKDQFKALVRELDLPSPHTADFGSLPEAKAYLETVTFPQIIKPVDLGGGKGISVAYSVEEGIRAVELAYAKSKVKHIVIEDFIEGRQFAFICFIHKKKVVFDYLSNDFSYLNPYMVWAAFGFRDPEGDTVREQIIADVEKIAAAKNIADGVLTIQLMIRDGKPYYLETMRRCLGNCHFKSITTDCGVDFYKLFVANEAGLDCEPMIRSFRPCKTYSGFMGIYAPANGKIRSITLDPEFETYVTDAVMLNGPGYVMEDYLHDKLGMVFYTFDSLEQKEYFMGRRRELFHVCME